MMVCLCGWNWGKVVPLLVYLVLLAAVYLLIWLTRWVRWYAEVAVIREKLGLPPGPSPLKWKETLPYVPVALLLCLGVPWLLRQLEGSGMPLLSGAVYAQILLPIGCLASGMFLGRRRGFCPLYPVVCTAAMLIAVFLVYNYTVLVLFCAIAFASSLLGVAAGANPRKKKED